MHELYQVMAGENHRSNILRLKVLYINSDIWALGGGPRFVCKSIQSLYTRVRITDVAKLQRRQKFILQHC